MSDLEKKFQIVLQHVKEGTASPVPTQTQKLQLYAWYKQATEGDAPPEGPGGLDIVARAKHAAWIKVQGMSKEAAMEAYVGFFKSL